MKPKIFQIIAHVCDTTVDKLTVDTKFEHGSREECIQRAMIAIQLEGAFDISISVDEEDSWETIADVIKTVERLKPCPLKTPSNT